MYVSIRDPKEFEIIGLNINSSYFQALSLSAKQHVQKEILKWFDLFDIPILPEVPSLEDFWFYDASTKTSHSPWDITLSWYSPGIILEDDKDFTLFSALVDNLSPEERKNLNLSLSTESVAAILEINLNHTGSPYSRLSAKPSDPREYPLVSASGRIILRLPKEAKDFLTGLGKIKEITEVSTRESLMCEI